MENRTHTQRGIAGLLLVMWLSHAVLAGTIIYVDPQAPGDNDGSSWTNAYLCLQNALESAEAGDEIRAAQGTYRPDQRTVVYNRSLSWQFEASGDVTETFSLPDGVVIEGGYAGYSHFDPNALGVDPNTLEAAANIRDVNAYPSILSGDLDGDDIELTDLQWQTLFDYVTNWTLANNAYHVVTTPSDTSSDTILDGFTITAGHGGGGRQSPRRNSDVAWPYPSSTAGGSGAYISGAPVFLNCTFYRNTVHSLSDCSAGGAGVYSEEGTPLFQACTFEENIAFGYSGDCFGAAVLDYWGQPQLVDCTFKNNIAAGFGGSYLGGAVVGISSYSELTGCTFIGNQAVESEGGAIFIYSGYPKVTNCVFTGNTADRGGAVSSMGSHVTLVGCVFVNNEATNAGQGGAAFNGNGASDSFLNCRFFGNTATDQGGAICGMGSLAVTNCLFSGNSAQNGGAICDDTSAGLDAVNSTFTANYASEKGGAYFGLTGSGRLTNCILWNDTPQEVYSLVDTTEIGYSDVQGDVSTGQGNIDADPQFRDALGPDGVAGTLDDDLYLLLDSPCIDVGNNETLLESIATDLAGEDRIVNDLIDMGAYEFNGPYNYYVDALVGDDTFEGYSPSQAFATIQRGIAAAQDGYTVVVLPGLYTEEVNFDGKAITVAGSEGGAVLEAPDGYGVSFYTAEPSTSVLKNFVIHNCNVGIFIAGASPTLQNVTLANNQFGITAYAGANPDISNCILWGNADGDLFGCSARFSCVQDGSEGEGNISQDPLFGDAEGGEYHLLAERGRFVSAYGLWSFDTKTSPCVDAGNPLLSPGTERMPNGGRINMGAFGGTPEASLSEWPLVADLNRDGIVDDLGMSILSEQWLQELPW